MKVNELTGAALDWAVTMALGLGEYWDTDDYSSNWALAGPIIERECIELVLDGWGAWNAAIRGGDKDDLAHGPTPLVAAMRCYVASQLGDEVDVPEELK